MKFINKNNNKNDGDMTTKYLQYFIIAVLIMVTFDLLTTNKVESNSTKKEIAYSNLKKLIKTSSIDEIVIKPRSIEAIDIVGKRTYVSQKENVQDQNLIELLDKKDISYTYKREPFNLLGYIFELVFPILLILGLLLWFSRKSMSGGMLGNSSKEMEVVERPNVTFKDVAGNKEAKEEVKEIIDFLRSPDKYLKLGAQIPKGLLLVGPPGTGKTLLAKAVAGEANVPFYSVAGSSFIEMFVGMGAKRVRDLFKEAKENGPSIIFIDEIDAIGKKRSTGGMQGNDEREQTLNQLLAEIDGFSSESSPVIVLAATNRPETLDAALTRPGRFDRQVLVDVPDFEGRKEVFNVHLKKIKVAKDIDLDEIGKLTSGLAGADISNICNEAALLAGRKEKGEVEQSDFMEAIERAIAGIEKKSKVISPKEKEIISYHECGHAIMAQLTKGANKVTKVSIIPRGLAALGYTLNAPEENKNLVQKHELIAEIDVLLGGRAAEEIFVGEISSGASNDLERATNIIKTMISSYGMTDILGLMVLDRRQNSFLGDSMSSTNCSQKTAEIMDDYIIKFLGERYSHVLSTLETYRNTMEEMSSLLMEKEVISGKEVDKIIKATV